jgi:hypothetical protein
MLRPLPSNTAPIGGGLAVERQALNHHRPSAQAHDELPPTGSALTALRLAFGPFGTR